MFNELPYRKAKKIWKEFPYLWGMLQDWSQNYEIRVRRLSSGELGIAVRPGLNRVFLHMTRIGEPFCMFDWWETVEEAPAVDYSRRLVDSLFDSMAVQLCAKRGKCLVIDAVVVLDTIRVSGMNTTEKHDADIITIYKQPRGISIYELIVSKWMSIHAHVGVKC